MKRPLIAIAASLFALASAVLMSGCFFDDDESSGDSDAQGPSAAPLADRGNIPLGEDEPFVDDLIVEGKEALEIRDAQTAHEKFQMALVYDPDNSDAACGLVLADGILVLDTVSAILGQLEDPAMPEDDKSGGMGENAQRLIRETLMPVLVEMTGAIEIALADPKFNFWLEHYPLVVDGEHAIIDMGKEWDAADMVAARGFALLLMGFSNSLLSIEVDFDWNIVFNWDYHSDGSLVERIIAICDLLITLLSDEDYPDFLKLNDEGYELLPLAGLQLGHGFRDLGTCFDLARMEADPQDDDVFGYVDANGNGEWDPDEVMRVPLFGELTPNSNITFNLFQYYALGIGASFLDGTEDDIDPDNPNKWNLSDLTMLMWNIGLGFQIPDFEIDFGEFYRDPKPDGLHNTLLILATVIKEALEGDGGAS